MDSFYLKPSPGAKVRDPVTKEHLKADGESKPRDSYWLRRVADGVVSVVINPAAVTSKAADLKGGK